MKRASLSALPARARPEPADLTDRLLAREAGVPAEPATPEAPPPAAATTAAATAPANPPVAAKPAPKPAPRRRARTGKQRAAAPAEAAPAPAGEAEAPTLEQALRQADQAARALRQAARDAPARYELAVRFRLEALAHHVQQVAEFIAGRAAPPR